MALRMERMVAIGVVVVASACGNRLRDDFADIETSATDGSTGGDSPSGGVQLDTRREVDILFVIDNTATMGATQGRLAAAMATLVEELEDPEMPLDYRIGITTTDNGNHHCTSTTPEAGRMVASSCRSRMEDFVFAGAPTVDATAFACTDVCATDVLEIEPSPTEFDTRPTARPWFEGANGITNVGGDVSMAEALRCALPQGVAGCGFESQLESMHKSLLRARTDDEAEYGFVRSSAALAIVVVTDEVDCSANAAHASIFLPPETGGNSVFWSNPGGAQPTSAVCWNAGVECEGSPDAYLECHAENKDTAGSIGVSDDDAVLQPVSRYVNFLQGIETYKQQRAPDIHVIFALVGGVPRSYAGPEDLQYADALDPEEQVAFGIGAGCDFDDAPGAPTVGARPPVRAREVAESMQIGTDPNVYSVCDDEFASTMRSIVTQVRQQIRPSCMSACVADTDPAAESVQPSCTLEQETPDVASGSVVHTDIPPCGPGDALPEGADVCFNALVGDAMSDFCTQEGWNLEFELIRRSGVVVPGGTSVSPSCELSQNKALDCPNLP